MAKEKDFLRGMLVPRLKKRSDSRLFAKRFHETLCELMGSDGIDPAMCRPNLQDLVSMTIAVADAKGYKNIEGCVDAMPVAFTALADDDVRQMDVPEGLGVDVEAWCEGPDPELADVSSHRLMSLLGRPCVLTLPPDMRPTFVDVHGDEISPTCIVTHPAALDMSRTGTDHTWVVAYDPKRSNAPAVTVVPNATAPFGQALENAMAQMTEKVAARKMTMGKDFQAPGMLADVMSPSLAAPRALSDQEGRYYRLMEESVGEIGRWDANLMAFTTNLLLHLELADELSERAALRAAVEEERTRSADMAQEMEREHEARVSALETRLDRSQMECDRLRKELERSDRDLQGALAEQKRLRLRLADAKKDTAPEGEPDEADEPPVMERPRFFQMPQTPEEALDLAQKLYPDRLLVLPDAYGPASEWKRNGAPELWEHLVALADGVWSLVFEDGKVLTDAGAKARTGIDCATRSSKRAKNDPIYMSRITFDVGGRPTPMHMHTKGTRNDGKQSLRVHFTPDADAKLIVIGYAGKHIVHQRTSRQT